MGDKRAALCERNARSAGVAEKVKNVEPFAAFLDDFSHSIPVISLFGEKSGVLEAHGFDEKFAVAPADRPFFGHIAENLPFAAAVACAKVSRVKFGVLAKVERSRPDRLRIGS